MDHSAGKYVFDTNGAVPTPSTPQEFRAFLARDIEVHKTRNTPKCATSVVLDMSGSMRHGGRLARADVVAVRGGGKCVGQRGRQSNGQ